MKFRREWAMPNKNTFDIPPITAFVRHYLSQSKISIDPFARNNQWATYTNDLNPKTRAEWHMDVFDFLQVMKCEKRVVADLVLFDPPYSSRQVKECYEGIGRRMKQKDGQRTHRWTRERDLINELTKPGAIVLSFGWDTVGMGQKRGFDILEIMLVCHGGGHNDTICMSERKIWHQENLI